MVWKHHDLPRWLTPTAEGLKPGPLDLSDVSMALFDTTDECLQVSEEQLNDAIAQAVENSKLRKDKSQWGANGDTLLPTFLMYLLIYMWFCPLIPPPPKTFSLKHLRVALRTGRFRYQF